MPGTTGGRRWVGVAAAGLVGLIGVGCVHVPQNPMAGPPPLIEVPPKGEVPREMDKITFPPYVIEAPDTLLIEVFVRGRVKDEPDAPAPKPADPQAGNQNPGAVPAAPPFPNAGRFITRPLPVQQITGQFIVRMDGTVGLGFWGAVPVAGLNLEQAATAIRNHLLTSPTLQELGVRPENLFVLVDVLAYNSKKYYVILDGGGAGEQVYPFPIYGSETVLDAIGNVNGLHAVASKRNIWVARRCPHPGQPWQILPVDWIGITQHGITVTNYQVLPGDRIYVKAQRLVTIDTALARVLNPIERLFGITLLGASTVNNISGRNVSGTGQ
jgi:polysaccharide export outer membrane protein